MSSNSSGFVHKVFLTSNRAFAELCASKIMSTHPGLCLDIHSDFELYVSSVHKKVTDADLIRIDYFFIDEAVMALPALDRIQNLHVNFLISEGIDGVAFDLVQCTASQTPDLCGYAQSHQVISSWLYNGFDIRRKRSRFRRELISKIQTLNIVKSFIPKVHSYFLLGEFLDSCFQRLQKTLHSAGGILIVEEKKNSKTIFHKLYGETVLDRAPATRLRSPVCRRGLVFKDVPEPDGSETQGLEARPPAVQICASVESSYARGYFKIEAEPPITACDKALVKVFKEQMGLFIDKTLTSQEMLERLNLNLSLIEPEVDGMMSVDKNKGIQGFDSAAKALTGGNRDEAPGLQCKKLWMVCDCFGTTICQGSRCFVGKAGREHQALCDNEIRIIRRNGVKRIAKSGWGPDRNTMGQVTYGGAVTRYMTERFNLNKFSHIEQMAWLGEFASELAHEIRNPVTSISSSAQFLCETADIAEEYKAVIEEILLGSKILEETVKKYLNLIKPPAPRLEKCNLNALLEQVCMSMQARIASQKITVELKLGEELPRIYVDPGQVRQVYMNLVMNALEAMPDGGKLEIETFLRTEGADSKTSERTSVVSSISDSGRGINLEDTEKVFDPFYTTKHSGSGLGLYTAFNILRKHNAEIRLFSEAEKGTEVTVSFPFSNGP